LPCKVREIECNCPKICCTFLLSHSQYQISQLTHNDEWIFKQVNLNRVLHFGRKATISELFCFLLRNDKQSKRAMATLKRNIVSLRRFRQNLSNFLLLRTRKYRIFQSLSFLSFLYFHLFSSSVLVPCINMHSPKEYECISIKALWSEVLNCTKNNWIRVH
jgi:hypothetical protein